MLTREIKIGNTAVGSKNPLVIIAGPCVIETEKSTIDAAKRLKKISEKLKIPLIFKSSYDKANRTSISSPRGPGIEKGLKILEKVKKETGMPVLSDIHSPEEVAYAAEVLDVFQIPAFLCRQTDLIVAASKTGKPVNIKKGQFLAPWEVKNIIEKFTSTGNHNLLITERGTSFGYNNLVVDMRSILIMQEFGYPVIFDATHSVQLPGGLGSASGGQREFVAPLSKAAVAVGCNGLFLEVHQDPDKALCDGPNMLRLDDLEKLLTTLKNIDELLNRNE
ncbi:MAG: 3-deoxy-8-phosphooctulonate synthase [Nitrospirae bacterium RIFCSPHIGHO2_02_FULL_40_19]|nr:MAG: 3-deoxy-8-phosphooctulonate synthase [Nitrospirae bacterium RIFCSPHIGHO2_02_FULL_40_19]